MDWKTFQDIHFRPHIIIAKVGTGARAREISLLERLAAAVGVSGSYAIKRDGTNVHVAFESDVDATRFAKVLRPALTTREPEWASRALARIDDATQRKITAVLKQHRLKNAKRR